MQQGIDRHVDERGAYHDVGFLQLLELPKQRRRGERHQSRGNVDDGALGDHDDRARDGPDGGGRHTVHEGDDAGHQADAD